MNEVNIRGLKAWNEPFVKKANFTSEDFNIFMPSFDPNVGDVWDMVPVSSAKYGALKFFYLSMNLLEIYS